LFDFVCPGAASQAIHPGAVVLPAAVLCSYFAHTLIALGPHIRTLKASGAGRILLLGTPAPKADGDFILGHLRTEAYFQDVAALAGIDLNSCRVTPASIRQKLWTLIQQMMAAVAAQEEVTFVPVPPETLDPDGLLKREYWQDDSTHANRAFGDRVRRVLEPIALAGLVRMQPPYRTVPDRAFWARAVAAGWAPAAVVRTSRPYACAR